MSQEEIPLGESLIRAFVGFPKYIIQWIGGLIVAILTDLHITTLAVTAVAVGFASSLSVGIATFFVIYSLSRIIAIIADGYVIGSNRIAQATAISKANG
jgi:hypothetical protein